MDTSEETSAGFSRFPISSIFGEIWGGMKYFSRIYFLPKSTCKKKRCFFFTTVVWQWNRDVWGRKLFSFEKCDWCSKSRCKKCLPVALRDVFTEADYWAPSRKFKISLKNLRYEGKYCTISQTNPPKTVSKFILPMKIFTFDDHLFFWLNKLPSSTLLESF